LASGGVGKKANRGEFQKYTPEKATTGMENEEQFIRSFLFTKSPTKSAMDTHLRQDQIRHAKFAGNALHDDLRSEHSRQMEETTDGGTYRLKRGNTDLQVETAIQEAAKKGEISTGDKTPKEWIKDQLNNSATRIEQNDKEDKDGGFCGCFRTKTKKPAKVLA